MAVKRLIKEDGIVIEKIFKEAMDSFKTSDGSIVPARQDTYILKCVSSADFTKENGFSSCAILDYKVEKAVYDKAMAYSPVIVRYEFGNTNPKPISAELKEKENK